MESFRWTWGTARQNYCTAAAAVALRSSNTLLQRSSFNLVSCVCVCWGGGLNYQSKISLLLWMQIYFRIWAINWEMNLYSQTVKKKKKKVFVFVINTFIIPLWLKIDYFTFLNSDSGPATKNLIKSKSTLKTLTVQFRVSESKYKENLEPLWPLRVRGPGVTGC